MLEATHPVHRICAKGFGEYPEPPKDSVAVWRQVDGCADFMGQLGPF